MILSALSRAFGQLPDPRIRKVLILSVILTLIGYLVLVVALAAGLGAVQALPLLWLDAVLDWAAGLALFVLALWLFPAAVTVVAGFFLDEVAAAVEAKHYPGLGPARAMSLAETLSVIGRFAVLALVVNLIALPFYVILPVLNLVMFYGLNGLLLSREFYDQAAHRRLPAPRARALRKRNALKLWSLGAVIAFLSTIPVINLLAPVVGTAAMVHLVQALAGSLPVPEPETEETAGDAGAES